jgi:hypothetical protein
MCLLFPPPVSADPLISYCFRIVNFFADPYAVDEVLISAATRLPLNRVLLLPLDITSSHLLPFSTYTTHVDPTFATEIPCVPMGETPLTHFTSAFLLPVRKVMRAFGQDALELHDIVAVWAAMAHPPALQGSASGWTVRRRLFQMERCALPPVGLHDMLNLILHAVAQNWRAYARDVRCR